LNITVFDIKRFAVHDGPGIRTTLFLKGCPLNCRWCHNPEGIAPDRQLWYFPNQCLKCGDCLSVCPEDALSLHDGGIQIHRDKCISCGKCTEICPTEALHFLGRTMDLDEIEEELLKDLPFFEESGGGITLSGGEPLKRIEEAAQILERMNRRGIHTAVESSLFVSHSSLKSILPFVDYFLADLKLIDSDEHSLYTDVPNEKILDNIRLLAETEKDVLIRIPLIPGFTDGIANLEGIGDFLNSLNRALPVELMNFNPLARDKFRILGRPYEPAGVDKPFSREDMDRFREILNRKGIQVL